jgi:hypothetical protein
MLYYFETNALRILNPKLNSYSNIGFTSVYSIFELICGIQKEYDLRKAVLTNAKKYLFIDWKFPEHYISESFESIEYEEQRSEDIKIILNLIIESKNLEDLLTKVKNSKLQYDIEAFLELKNNPSKHFIQTTEIGNIELNKLYCQQKEIIKLSEFKEKNLSKLKTLEKLQNEQKTFNEGATILAFSKAIAKVYTNGETTDDEIESVYNSYNGSVYFYIEAFSYYTIEKMKQGSIPEFNDWHDLYHLVYLKNNPNIKIVTNDKMILKLNKQLWREAKMAISINDFCVTIDSGSS